LREERGASVYGIARGGVIVAASLAQALQSPLYAIVVRKVGHPRQPELAIGAVSAAGDRVINQNAADFDPAELDAAFARCALEARELAKRLASDGVDTARSPRTAIVVDDGIATSATMQCASICARKAGARVVCAVPVAPASAVPELQACCDRIVSLSLENSPHFAVSRYYARFEEVGEDDVRRELRRAAVRIQANLPSS